MSKATNKTTNKTTNAATNFATNYCHFFHTKNIVKNNGFLMKISGADQWRISGGDCGGRRIEAAPRITEPTAAICQCGAGAHRGQQQRFVNVVLGPTAAHSDDSLVWCWGPPRPTTTICQCGAGAHRGQQQRFVTVVLGPTPANSNDLLVWCRGPPRRTATIC